MQIETKAILRNLRMSPPKVRRVLDRIRGLRISDALQLLEGLHVFAAKPVLKLLRSALANGKHNYDMDEKTAVISRAFVDGGATLFRWMPGAFGKASTIHKRTSHVTIFVTGESKKKDKDKEKKEKENTGSPLLESLSSEAVNDAKGRKMTPASKQLSKKHNEMKHSHAGKMSAQTLRAPRQAIQKTTHK